MSDLPPNYGKPISLEAAKKVMAAAEAEAVKNQWPMVIAIVDSTNHLVMLHRMDQAQFGSSKVAPLKAETALNFRRPTKVFEDSIAGGGQGVRVVTIPDILALEGGLPILHNGDVIGAIGVSGMRSDQDAQVARAGIAALG